MITKRLAWDFLQESEDLSKALADKAIPNEVKFYRMGMFIRYCNEFASNVEQTLPSPEFEKTP